MKLMRTRLVFALMATIAVVNGGYFDRTYEEQDFDYRPDRAERLLIDQYTASRFYGGPHRVTWPRFGRYPCGLTTTRGSQPPLSFNCDFSFEPRVAPSTQLPDNSRDLNKKVPDFDADLDK